MLPVPLHGMCTPEPGRDVTGLFLAGGVVTTGVFPTHPLFSAVEMWSLPSRALEFRSRPSDSGAHRPPQQGTHIHACAPPQGKSAPFGGSKIA